MKVVLALFLTGAAGAQQVGPVQKTASRLETTVSLGVAAQATISSGFSGNYGATGQAFDRSATVLATVRQSFAPWFGYTVSLGYTRTTEENSAALSYYVNGQSFAIPVNVYETSLAYTVQRHLGRRVTAFADLGGGVLTFLPVHRGATAKNFVPNGNYALVPSVLFRQLGVAGVGLDYRLTQHLRVRAEYRGLLYKYPDFGERVGKAMTETSEPTVSMVYRFGK